MESVAFAIPLLADRTATVRTELASCWEGSRKEAHQDARRRAGIVRESVWLQRAPHRDLVVVYLEADDLNAALTTLADSVDPFDRWFRDHVRRVHGLELADGFGAPELVLDFDINRI